MVRFTLGTWNNAQLNYNTIKKEILSIILCISKFQDDILNQEFLLRVDCKSVKSVLQKDVKNITSKHIFARWEAILSNFDFQIEYIKWENNSIPDFLTRGFCRIHGIMAPKNATQLPKTTNKPPKSQSSKASQALFPDEMLWS